MGAFARAPRQSYFLLPMARPLPSPPAVEPRVALVKRLVELGEEAARQGTAQSAAEANARLMAYSCRARERAALLTLESPWLLLVLEGHKRIDAGSASYIVRAGETMLLPRGTSLAISNVPDARTGAYRGLGVEVLGAAHALVQRHHPDLMRDGASWLAGRLRTLRAGTAALRAFVHFCETMLAADAHPRVLHHALEGLLLALLVEEEIPP